MPLQRIRTRFEGEFIYSPFTGSPADSGDDSNSPDSSVLFVHYGDAGEYVYIAEAVRDNLRGRGISQDPQEMSPEELAQALEIQGAMVLEVDAGWNGINEYGFAPPADD